MSTSARPREVAVADFGAEEVVMAIGFVLELEPLSQLGI
jgi:hypothetical protein